MFNCGDCRVYSIEDGVLTKITHDHSVVQELCDKGVISEEEARTDSRRNRLTAALKAGKISVNLKCRRLEIASAKRFLICCDGVWQTLPREELGHFIAAKPIADAAEILYDELIKTECEDNISFILLETED